ARRGGQVRGVIPIDEAVVEDGREGGQARRESEGSQKPGRGPFSFSGRLHALGRRGRRSRARRQVRGVILARAKLLVKMAVVEGAGPSEDIEVLHARDGLAD